MRPACRATPAPTARLHGPRDSDTEPSADLGNRQFTVDEPNQLWITDIIEHPTVEGKIYCDRDGRLLPSETFSPLADRQRLAAASLRINCPIRYLYSSHG